jgi:hypothetical protein
MHGERIVLDILCRLKERGAWVTTEDSTGWPVD